MSEVWKSVEDINIFNFTPEPCRGTVKMIEKFPRITCEAKLDGIRYVLMIKSDGTVTLTGRRSSITSGGKINRIENFPQLRDVILATKIHERGTFILDCEMTHPKGLQVLLGLMNSAPDVSQQKMLEHGFPTLYVFDCLGYTSRLLDDFMDMKNQFLHSRRTALANILRWMYEEDEAIQAFIRHIPVLGDNTLDMPIVNKGLKIARAYDEAISLGYEGIIVKNLDGVYHKNNMVKFKPKHTYDYVILGYEESNSQTYYKWGIAAIVLGLYDSSGKLKVLTKCSGITEEIRHEFYERGSSHLGKVVEVAAQEMFPTGALRHPRFIRFRDDLNATDQTFAKYGLKEL